MDITSCDLHARFHVHLCTRTQAMAMGLPSTAAACITLPLKASESNKLSSGHSIAGVSRCRKSGAGCPHCSHCLVTSTPSPHFFLVVTLNCNRETAKRRRDQEQQGRAHGPVGAVPRPHISTQPSAHTFHTSVDTHIHTFIRRTWKWMMSPSTTT